MTEKLFEQNSYCKEFTATVLQCEKQGEYYEIVLDKTAFFPEGGGQAADQGKLNHIDVLDVQIQNETIIHKTAEPIEAGTAVTGVLDWDLRFSRMQSHSAEHIVSGIAHSMFGYENVGFHMSARTMTVDFDGTLTKEHILEIEKKANLAVYANKQITASFPTPEEAETIPYRSKLDITQGLRLVTIDGVDCCACCAPHVGYTGEIGLIKIIDVSSNKGGTRIEMIAGIYALEDYISLNAANKNLMKLFSAKRDEVEDAVSKQNTLVTELKNENAKLLKRLAIAELDPVQTGDVSYAFCDGLSYDALRHCANFLIEKGAEICVLLSETEAGTLYVASSNQADVKPIVTALNSAFNGKGGGKPNYAQGKLSSGSKEEIAALLFDFSTIR